jgi:hypothetical protein
MEPLGKKLQKPQKLKVENDNDDENIGKAVKLLFELGKLNPEIKLSEWSSSYAGLLIEIYLCLKVSYKHFSADLERIKETYKQRLNENL